MVVLVSKAAFATSTTESSNLVSNTFDYIGPGRLTIYAKSSAAAVKINCFINGQQVLRNNECPFTGTAGTLDMSANMMIQLGTAGGRVEITVQATTGTPTMDLLVQFDPIGGAVGRAFSRLLGR